MNHVATARNKVGGEWLEQRLYRTPAGEWIMLQPNRPPEELSEEPIGCTPIARRQYALGVQPLQPQRPCGLRTKSFKIEGSGDESFFSI
jgi:hypothetical protein